MAQTTRRILPPPPRSGGGWAHWGVKALPRRKPTDNSSSLRHTTAPANEAPHSCGYDKVDFEKAIGLEWHAWDSVRWTLSICGRDCIHWATIPVTWGGSNIGAIERWHHAKGGDDGFYHNCSLILDNYPQNAHPMCGDGARGWIVRCMHGICFIRCLCTREGDSIAM